MHPTPADASTVKVTTLELFFDLVFVFTITQVTGLVVKAHSLGDYYKALLVLTVTWWMYAGYVWLTNNINVRQTRSRLFLLLGMAGFLIMALALPKVFAGSGVVFGLGFLLVVLVHTGLFTHSFNAASASAIWNIAPYNLVAAGLVLLAGLPGIEWGWLAWTLAVAVLALSSFRRSDRGFVLSPGHFAERHGLVVLIALGESIVAIGAGAADEPLGVGLLLTAVLGLTLTAALWWVYFHADDSRAEGALLAAEGDRRSRLALGAYGYVHLFIIAGIVVMAAGVKQVLAHLDQVYPAAAWNLGCGVALYLLGHGLFRRVMGIDQGYVRWVAGALALLSISLGLWLGGLVQLLVLLALLVGLLVLDR